ncbi:MAG: YheU family protein [Gammaproteobacteria bacterium]
MRDRNAHERDDATAPAPVEVPWQALSSQALRGVVEAFVLREGTDYGVVEASFADKVEAVMRQLERGEARIYFEPVSQSVELVPARVPGPDGDDSRA